jgi:hydrogenase-4 component E
MTGSAYTGPLGLAAGAVLACAVVTLWRRDLRAVVSVLAVQGTALGIIGFFMLATRRKAVSQIVGLLLIDNGIALATFLLTAGVPLLVEFGAALDVLLVVVVLRVLATTMRARFGPFDLDQLRELRD